MGNLENELAETLVTLTSEIVSAHLSNNSVEVSDVSGLIEKVYDALSKLGTEEAQLQRLEPAVPIRSSVKKDHIICLEDGRKMKMLKRHLRTAYGMSPEEYRARWNLPVDYPMVAPNYAEKRRELAVRIGLGREHGRKRKRTEKAKKSS